MRGVEGGDKEGVSLGEQGAELAGPGVAIAAGKPHAQPAAAVVVPAEGTLQHCRMFEYRTPT